MAEEKIKILYIDDEENNLMSFKAVFRMDFSVFIANSAKLAREIISKEEGISVIISDQRMPDETGVEFFSSILQTNPDSVRILLTGYSDIEAVIDSINKGQIYRYLQKPWNEIELRKIIVQANEVYHLREENKRMTEELKRANEQLEFLYRQTLIN